MEDFELNLDNILDPDELAELSGNNDNDEDTSSKEEEVKKDNNTEDLNISDLFGPESVGDEKEDTRSEEKGTTTTKVDSTSPNNLYSSIAKALAVDGIFPDLSDDDAAAVNTAEKFYDLMNKRIESGLNEAQQRITKALNAGVEPSKIQIYENSIKNLNAIKEEDINDESERGINLRKLLIKTDFINKGVNEERAEILAERAFKNDTDIEDAKEALKGNKEYYTSAYNKLISDAEREAAEAEANKKKEIELLKKSILEENKAFGSIDVDKNTRQRVYDVISKPIHRDEDGNYYTELQKYEMEHKRDFMKNLGYVYVITDGFKSLDKIADNIKKKVTSNGIKELEHTLNTTARNLDGSLKFVSGVGDDNSYINSGWSIDTK